MYIKKGILLSPKGNYVPADDNYNLSRKEENNMNKSSKRIVSVFAAVVLAAAMSVSAFAADYGSAPSYSDTTSTTPSATSEEVINSIDEAVKGADPESGEVKATVEVDNTKSLVLTAETIKKLKETENGTLEIVSPKITISIDSASVNKAAKINLSSSVSNTKKSSTVKLVSKVKFGCEVKITVTSCKMSKAALEKAHAYVTVKDPETGKVTTKDLGPVELDENGYPVITATQGGEYTIK